MYFIIRRGNGFISSKIIAIASAQKIELVDGYRIKVITKLPNSEQSYKGKVQTHNYYGTALTNILPILFLYLNTVTVTTGTFEP
jgi:hypothetical protein